MGTCEAPRFVPHGQDRYQYVKMQFIDTSDEAVQLSYGERPKLKDNKAFIEASKSFHPETNYAAKRDNTAVSPDYFGNGGGGNAQGGSDILSWFSNKKLFSFGPYKPWIMFGVQIAPAYQDDPLWGNRDGGNTGYTNWEWSSPDVQVPIAVIGGLTTLGASLEAQGTIRAIGFLNLANTTINLSGLDSSIPGYNNPCFKALRDATFIASDLYKGIPTGVFASCNSFRWNYYL
ncbi:hypothetical protein [Saccharicrinis aurantiacus]|uniref:hypothetical protein n=1 Tax=Saccharicrinis aurantiacus TaxID=1849719 RepID=UPI00094F999F|nr:hypothetical protein [Saccharicrinis aurantiacus]